MQGCVDMKEVIEMSCLECMNTGYQMNTDVCIGQSGGEGIDMRCMNKLDDSL